MIEATREMGLAPEPAGGALVQLREQAELAEVRSATKTGYQGLLRVVDETLTELRSHRKDDRSIDQMLEEICEVFGMPPDMLSEHDQKQLTEIYLRKPMTELARGQLVSMSDKTSISLEVDMLKHVVQAGKTVFDVHEDDYVHKDEIVQLILQFYSQAEVAFRAIAGEEEWLKFMAATKDVARSMSDRPEEQLARVMEG